MTIIGVPPSTPISFTTLFPSTSPTSSYPTVSPTSVDLLVTPPLDGTVIALIVVPISIIILIIVYRLIYAFRVRSS